MGQTERCEKAAFPMTPHRGTALVIVLVTPPNNSCRRLFVLHSDIGLKLKLVLLYFQKTLLIGTNCSIGNV